MTHHFDWGLEFQSIHSNDHVWVTGKGVFGCQVCSTDHCKVASFSNHRHHHSCSHPHRKPCVPFTPSWYFLMTLFSYKNFTGSSSCISVFSITISWWSVGGAYACGRKRLSKEGKHPILVVGISVQLFVFQFALLQIADLAHNGHLWFDGTAPVPHESVSLVNCHLKNSVQFIVYGGYSDGGDGVMVLVVWYTVVVMVMMVMAHLCPCICNIENFGSVGEFQNHAAHVWWHLVQHHLFLFHQFSFHTIIALWWHTEDWLEESWIGLMMVLLRSPPKRSKLRTLSSTCIILMSTSIHHTPTSIFDHQNYVRLQTRWRAMGSPPQSDMLGLIDHHQKWTMDDRMVKRYRWVDKANWLWWATTRSR